MQPESALPPLSLLWPAGVAVAGSHVDALSASAAEDLNLMELIHAMQAVDAPPIRLQQRVRFADQILSQLGQQAEVITYRQDILEDLLADRPLRERLGQLLPNLEALAEVSSIPERYLSPGREALERIARR